jgi:hypothetical protein
VDKPTVIIETMAMPCACLDNCIQREGYWTCGNCGMFIGKRVAKGPTKERGICSFCDIGIHDSGPGRLGLCSSTCECWCG